METALWNPWLRQVNLIKFFVLKEFNVVGLGYDNSRPKKVHKLLLYYPPKEAAIYDCASHVLRNVKTPYVVHLYEIVRQSHVSLYGNLYLIARNLQTCQYFIQSLDFSEEIFKPFGRLPLQVQDNSWLD
ncbi:Protein SUPPRESSOR OF NIM1 1 [Raphanus sativus]|nr:Protein SUPPRESSOR OF NIM1 1 [Raphanus sativus]